MKKTTAEINEALIKKYAEALRPESPEIRAQIDIGYSYNGSTVILYEIRPAWDNPKEILHHEFAKMRYYKSRDEWNLYWMRASGKWQIYGPFPESPHLEKMLKIIIADKYACFFG